MAGGRKSRHYRDESDPLLFHYSERIAATSSVRNYSSPLHSTPPRSNQTLTSGSNNMDDSSGRLGSLVGDAIPLPLFMPGFNNSSREENSPIHNGNSFHDLPSKDFKREKKAGYRVHRVSYTAQNHVQVLFQMYGSAFPQVLPFCAINILWAIAVVLLKKHNILDLTFHSSVGHSFMGLLVSFLVVSRSKISYDRFMDFRRNLAVAYHSCREMAQFTTVYTMQTQSERAMEWRQEVCYRTILLLRVTMDALLWSSSEREKWEEEYFKYKKTDGQVEDVSEHFFRFRRLTHGRRSMIDENFRAPISFSHVLRQVIMQHPDYLGYKLAVNEYRDLLNFVTIFNKAFHEFRVLIFTPYPFPLVQMTRAFLFFWVYSLPLVLLKEYRFWSSIIIVLFGKSTRFKSRVSRNRL